MKIQTSKFLLMICIFACIPYSFAEHDVDEKPAISWSGFVNTDVWLDTRQTVTKRNGHELLFPEPVKLDARECDINSRGKSGIIPFIVRLIGRLDGPPLLSSNKTYALFSGDFRGIDDTISPVLRFRKGYLNFDWKSFSWLIGQTNHPLYVADCRPHTVAYSRVAPLDTRARVPQLRFTWRPGILNLNGCREICGDSKKDEILFALYSQSRTTQSNGPAGISRNYIQDAIVPGIHLQCRKFYKNFLCGVGVDFKRIVPRLETVGTNLKDDKSITSGVVAAYMAYAVSDFALRTKVLYVHDGNEFGLISGYAVATEDMITKKRTYANLRSVSYWIDCDMYPESVEGPWSFGALFGFSKNLGSKKKLFRGGDNELIAFAGAVDIGLLVRIAPRARYTCGPVVCGAEIEWTYAQYAGLGENGKKQFSDYGVPCRTAGISNVRFLMNMQYHF